LPPFGNALPLGRYGRTFVPHINKYLQFAAHKYRIFQISIGFGANKYGFELKKCWHAVCLKGFILGFGHVPPKF
jgi:hypothetical protein